MTDTPTTPPPLDPAIEPIAIEEEMKRSYLDYAMSVIVARALPDVRDGLKPVHRRILHAMREAGYTADRPYRKSARIVGDVMGKYHPHGDQAIYDAMVRMAQDFSMRLPLLDGQGNFGSMDGDPPAAMRYTEIRLAPPAEALLADIDNDTVDFQPNYDESAEEPVVLPATFPNILVNGANGIAVGMATNIPPHNAAAVIDACCAYLDDPTVEVADLIEIVKGPDFPTGGLIMGQAGIRAAYTGGRGSIVMRGRVHFEPADAPRALVITEIPYQVNKSSLIEKIAEGVRAKRIEGISDLRDESDRDGVRVVVELRRDAMPEIVENQLYRFTPLQSTFGVNALALNHGQPETFNLRDFITAFVGFREVVVTRRTKHLLAKARARAHVLIGLAVAVANIDEMIALIRAAPDPASARQALIERDWPAASDIAALVALVDDGGEAVLTDGAYRLSETQARAILDLRLQRLTALGRDEIGDELGAIERRIRDYLEILSSRERMVSVIREELLAARESFGQEGRRTEIVEDFDEAADEDLIQPEDMVVTVSHAGYIKRVPLSTYRTQRRGGRGRAGMATRDEDFVSQLFVLNTHTPVLFFSSLGRVYRLKVYRLPIGTPQARGKAMVNLLPLAEGETIHTLMPMPADEATWSRLYVMFATSQGQVRRNALSDFAFVPSGGKIAMKVEESGDRIVGVDICTESDDVMLAARHGKCVRFPVIDVRVFKSRASTGVRGIRLGKADSVISMSILAHADLQIAERDAYLRWAIQRRRADDDSELDSTTTAPPPARADALAAREQFVLTVTENGYGKRSSAYEYRVTSRGGQGIINIETSIRNGQVVAAFPVGHDDEIMLVTDRGRLIRCPVEGIRIAGRNTQGVTLFSTDEGEHVVSVARLDDSVAGNDNGNDTGNDNGNDTDTGESAESEAREGD